MKKTILALTTFIFIAGATAANAAIINYEDGVLQTTSSLANHNTYGSDMYGMTVAITYADTDASGTVSFNTVSYDWGLLASGLTGVDFATGTFTLTGRSWTTEWILDVTDEDIEISSILIDAGAGDAVFDVIYDPEGSANSARGWAINTSYDNMTATYSGAVGIGDDSPVGDLYRYLTLDFTSGYFGYDDELSFYADTDNLLIPGDINPVPEPSTILLFGLGITGLIGLKRKQNCNK